MKKRIEHDWGYMSHITYDSGQLRRSEGTMDCEALQWWLYGIDVDIDRSPENEFLKF